MAAPPRSFDMTVNLGATLFYSGQAAIPRGQTFTIVPVPGGGTRASWTVDDFGVPWPHGNAPFVVTPQMAADVERLMACADGHDPGDEDR